MKQGNFLDDVGRIEPLFRDMPRHWDAKEAIMEMKNSGDKQWRQMEWIGFYFQYLCEKRLKSIMQLQQPRYGKTSFDGFLSCAWDFKVHPKKNSKGQIISSVIINDTEATLKAIDQFGSVGLLLAAGNAKYNDEDRSLQAWHKNLKGGLSKYENQRILRDAPSRLRKVSFDLEEILFIKIDTDTLKKTGEFQKGFRNSDGSPRRVKILLDLNTLTTEIVSSIKY
jgi:hypothetical protein